MNRFDLAVFNAIHRFWGTSRFLNFLGRFFADTMTYLMVIGAIVFILYSFPSNRDRIFVCTELMFAFFLSRLLFASNISFFVKRPRPFKFLGFVPPFMPLTAGSFPSGHTSALFSIAFVIFTLDPLWGTAYFILSFLVGAARVFIGVHWPSDILAGIILGLGSGYLIQQLFWFQGWEVLEGLPPPLTDVSSSGGV